MRANDFDLVRFAARNSDTLIVAVFQCTEEKCKPS